LKAVHHKVEDLFEKFEGAKSADRQQAWAHEICVELKIHTLIEEEIFNLAFRGLIEEDTLGEACVEHDGAKVLINDIDAGSPDDAFYGAKVKVLSEEIKHHVHEEEQASEGSLNTGRRMSILWHSAMRWPYARRYCLPQAKAGGLPAAKPTAVNLLAA
jgi:hypothetical protein